MVHDTIPTADDGDELSHRMEKMVQLREKMLTDASVNINNAQARYKTRRGVQQRYKYTIKLSR